MQHASDLASDVISSLSWFFPSSETANSEDSENGEYTEEIVEQFVDSVDEFSSQYGSEVSVSYTAFNLRGPPSNFPDYGDYPQAFVMRTYGTWWEEAPSAQEEFMPSNNPLIPSQDFVEVSFVHSVQPVSVNIFETYNPGAVVRIWALRNCSLGSGGADSGGWALLWEGAPERVGDTPRIFSPPIKTVNFSTKVLRLELNHRLLPYYTELDAVLLRGKRLRRPDARRPCNNYFHSSLLHSARPHQVNSALGIHKGEIMSRIIASNLHESVTAPRPITGQENMDQSAKTVQQTTFQSLPDETILYILLYLDLHTLCRCVCVSRHLRRLASDAMLYRCLSLRVYWHCLNSQGIEALSRRCKYLQKLDMSWCGSRGAITPDYFIDFLKECGTELTHLRLNNCKFVDNSVLKAIAVTSPHLQELCLRNTVGCTTWPHLSRLQQLRRLDLYRTDLTARAAVALVYANAHLQHINLGGCWKITPMDDVAVALGLCCRGLVSADFWKSYSLTPHGIRALSHCTQLQELDVGWCLQASESGEWLAWLGSTQLRKLFLGALRGVSDRDLRALVPRAPLLQQLDLLGVRAVTSDVCELILAECRDLRLLDLSFCDQISESQVSSWRQRYSHVSIKRSFQTTHTHHDLAPFVV